MENLNRKYEFSMNVEQLDSVFSTGAKFSTKDVKTGELHIQLTKSRNIINLNETLCYANILKPDGEVIAHECEVIDVEKGIVKLDLVTDAMNQPGLYNFEIVVTNSEEKLVTPIMQYQCYESLNDGDKIESSNEFGLLEKALIKVDLLRSEFEALYENLERNESTRVSNESIRTQNENQRQTNESNRVSSEQNRQTSFNKMVQDNNSYKDEIKNVINEFKEDINSDFDNYKKGINSDIFDDNKIDFFGKEHDSMKHRLNSDFDNLHQRINDSSLLPYEGTSIKADNTYYGLTKDTVIKGRTLQNLLEFKNINNSSFINSSKEIVVNGSNGASVNCAFGETPLLKPNTEYTVFVNIKKSTNYSSDKFVQLTFGGKVVQIYLGEGVKKVKFTTPSEITSYNAIFYFWGDYQVNEGSLTIGDFMLFEGDHTNTPIEELPFIEGIESTGDKSKNLFNGKLQQGRWSIAAGNFVSDDSAACTIDKIKVEPNTKYAFSSDYALYNITYLNGDTFIESETDLVNGVFVTPSDCNYIRVSLKNAPISAKMQIEKGTEATPYEPYYDGYKIEILSIGKNIFDKSTITDNTYINANGDVIPYDGWFSSDFIRVHKGEKYYIYNEKHREPFAGSYSYYYDVNKNKIERLNLGDFEFVGFKEFVSKYDGYIRISGITRHIEKGKFCADSDKAQILLNEPLRQLPNGVADSINLETGVLIRRVGKAVLDGTQKQWELETALPPIEGTLCFDNHKDFGLGKKFSYEAECGMICDKFPSYSREGIANNKNGIADFNGGFRIRIQTANLETEDVQGFIKWLSGNQVTVYYELAEPTTEQLTPTQLKSFEGTTHIISENKLMPIVSAKIPSDVNAVVQNLKAENVKLEKQLDSAIEELNNTDIDLIAMDWETDYRICELEWALLDTMKVETLAEGKAVESRILSRYEQAKILIKSGKYNKTTMEKQLTTYHNRRCLTDEEYNELMELMNR